MNKAEKEFDVGYQLGMKSVELLEKKMKNPTNNHLAGLVSSILNILYFYAPKEEYADELLEFAVNFAKKEAKEYRRSYTYESMKENIK
jgi:hypothetical protein